MKEVTRQNFILPKEYLNKSNLIPKVELEKGEQLEKENAELKHTIAELRRDKDNLNTHTKAQEKLSEYRSDQLTKAKEIIKNLLSAYTTYADSFDDRDNEIVSEAEQFLKEK